MHTYVRFNFLCIPFCISTFEFIFSPWGCCPKSLRTLLQRFPLPLSRAREKLKNEIRKNLNKIQFKVSTRVVSRSAQMMKLLHGRKRFLNFISIVIFIVQMMATTSSDGHPRTGLLSKNYFSLIFKSAIPSLFSVHFLSFFSRHFVQKKSIDFSGIRTKVVSEE